MRKIYLFFALIFIFMTNGCNNNYKIVVSENEIRLNINETYKLNYEIKNTNNNMEVIFEKSASGTVKIENNTITALEIGSVSLTILLKDHPEIKTEIIVIVESSFDLKTKQEQLYISETMEFEIENKTNSYLDLTWNSSNKNVATVENGVLSAHNIGKAIISVTSNKTGERKTIDINVIANDPKEIVIDHINRMYVNQEIILSANVLPKTSVQDVIWNLNDNTIAEINNGILRANKSGEIIITATSKINPYLSTTLTIEVYLDPIKLFESFNEENPIKQYVTTFGYNPSQRYQWVYGSVSKYFNADLNLIEKIISIDDNIYNGQIASPDILRVAENLKLVRSGILHEETSYITYHDTGNHTLGANAKMHADYMVSTYNRNQRARSWHYTVDENFVYHHIPDNEVAWQGDSYEAYAKSIGVETCVNFGSDLYTTWHRTAKLMASLLVKHNLNINDIKQHYDFNRKNCPQTLRMSNLYDNAIELVRAEYLILTELNNYQIKFTSLSPELVDDRGRVINLPHIPTKIGYTINITNDKGYDETITLYSNLPTKA